MGDAGAMISAKGGEGRVVDTEKKLGALHVHVVEVGHGGFAVGDAVELRVDGERRRATRANHSATHLLHAALKRVLGPHVSQKGSLVAPDRLRFDFSHPKPVSPDELEKHRDAREQRRAAKLRRLGRLMATDQAIEAGAEALFGENMATRYACSPWARKAPEAYSVELCGGTHRRRSWARYRSVYDLKRKRGGRRCATHRCADERRCAAISVAPEPISRVTPPPRCKTSVADLPQRVAQLADEERNGWNANCRDAKRAAVGARPVPRKATSDSGAMEIAGVKNHPTRLLEGIAAKDLKSRSSMKQKAQTGFGRCGVHCGRRRQSLARRRRDQRSCFAHQRRRSRARRAEALGGKGGGGRPDMAQGGGPDGAKGGRRTCGLEKKLATVQHT